MSNRNSTRVLITNGDMMDIFKVTYPTIYRWRNKGLENFVVSIPGGPKRNYRRYDLFEVLKWARKTGRETPGLKGWREGNHQTVNLSG